MTQINGWALLAIVTLGINGADTPTVQQEFFSEGNRLYQEGDYRGALDRYNRVVEAGYESGPLYYNIGNAHFKLGELGKAILNYERALRIDPRNEAVAANLGLARSMTADEITPLPRFWVFRVVDWWVHLIPLSWLWMIVGIGYVSAMSGVVLAILWRRSAGSVWGRRLALMGGVVAAAFAVNVAATEFEFGKAETAVILADEVSVQSAPSDDPALQVFTIHEGTRVRIDRRADEWLEIVLADGKVGWVLADVLEII
jgi:tetratricopeptide (TPR) repeat protein